MTMRKEDTQRTLQGMPMTKMVNRMQDQSVVVVTSRAPTRHGTHFIVVHQDQLSPHLVPCARMTKTVAEKGMAASLYLIDLAHPVPHLAVNASIAH